MAPAGWTAVPAVPGAASATLSGVTDLSLLLRGLGPSGVRDVNAGLLLELLRRHGPLSRTELLARAPLSKASVSVITADLVERGLVRESGTARSTRGPRRILLEFNDRVADVIGVQVSDDNCTFVRTDLSGRVLRRWRLDRAVSTPEALVDAVAAGLARSAARSEVPLLGVGLGVPGLVDQDCRRVLVALSHHWRDVALADALEARLAVPVTVANRAKVVALGVASSEMSTVKANPRDVLSLYLGDGVVAGAVIGGRLHIGWDGTAGDLGHLSVDPQGAHCECGRRGCLHLAVGRPAVLAAARRRAARSSTMQGKLTDWAAVVAAAAVGEPSVVRTAVAVGRCIGEVVAPLVAALGPEVVALTGPTADLGEPLLTAVSEVIGQRARTESEIPVLRADADAAPRGAAMLFLQQCSTLAMAAR